MLPVWRYRTYMTGLSSSQRLVPKLSLGYPQHRSLPTPLGKRESQRAHQPPRPDTSSCCQHLNSTSLQSATTGSLGLDVAAAAAVTLMTTQPEKVPTGIIGPIIIDGLPMGALLLGRSSATMMGLFVLPGVIDADCTGKFVSWCILLFRQ